MNFGFAIRALKDDRRVTRSGWNGEGMWVASQTDMLAEDWAIVDE